MRHFIYTYSERTPRNGHTVKTVRLFRIIRNEPQFVGEVSDTFVDKNQLAMAALQQFKALPRAAFARPENGSLSHTLWSLKSEGIATVTEI